MSGCQSVACVKKNGTAARGRRKMLMKTLLIPMLLLCCGFDAIVAARAGQEVVSRIEVHRTPGKAMQLFDPTRPAESITARHDGERYELIVAVNVPRKGIAAYSESSTALSRQDWDRLVVLVQQQELLRFKPDEEPGRVYDYGETGFTIEGRTSNAQQWSKPIKNSAAPRALMLRLARLARQKLPRVGLYYFPPDTPSATSAQNPAGLSQRIECAWSGRAAGYAQEDDITLIALDFERNPFSH
jgi:hypothetical protein